jgi:hypothetical protein
MSYDNDNRPSSTNQGGGGGEAAALSPNQANDNNDNNGNNFSFKYTESGGLTSRYLLISFDSNTNILRLLILVAAICHKKLYLIQINRN